MFRRYFIEDTGFFRLLVIAMLQRWVGPKRARRGA